MIIVYVIFCWVMPTIERGVQYILSCRFCRLLHRPRDFKLKCQLQVILNSTSTIFETSSYYVHFRQEQRGFALEQRSKLGVESVQSKEKKCECQSINTHQKELEELKKNNIILLWSERHQNGKQIWKDIYIKKLLLYCEHFKDYK